MIRVWKDYRSSSPISSLVTKEAILFLPWTFPVWASSANHKLTHSIQKLEPIIQSEVRQREKHQYSILTHISEKAIAPHSSSLGWKIPWMEEPGRLQSMGSLGVRDGWATSLSLFTFMHWRRKLQAIPVFLPGESQGQGSLVGCRLWGSTESDMTEAT